MSGNAPKRRVLHVHVDWGGGVVNEGLVVT